MISFIELSIEFFKKILLKAGLPENLTDNISQFTVFILLILFSYLAYVITWRIVRKILIPILKRSKNQFDDLLVKHNFFKKVSYLVPAFILYYFAESALNIFPSFIGVFNAILEIFFVIIAILIVDSLLSTLNDFYERYDFAKDNPIKGLVQIIKIIIYVIGLLIIIGNMLDQNLSSLVISLGTISAVLMLIFKDPILGFVGGMQLIFNKMLSIGDWISMPKFGADGTVLEINLTTVKVQNWDKTIVTIPTYSLISDSFQNWRGMEESGGRRIKRSINIDMDSVMFCTSEMLEKFKKIDILKAYIEKTELLIERHNKQTGADPQIKVNGLRQTNIGVFRAYLKEYLHSRPDIHDDMTFLVRQLQPSEKGIPIEIYVFTTTTEWANFENIQADIFDHVLAVIPEFDLRVFQFPSSGALEKVGKFN
ncbi:MAG: mechanosensitive ion channel protein MscS [Marinilabiliales bacterium]|nr:MAG: mechanosensitive ion channel protein MscS [Marinilabiliales bacterium]